MERDHRIYEGYHRYPDESEWAVKYHDDEHGPKGWPAEANPLQSGAPAPPGYERRTGKELNSARDKIIKSKEHEHHTKRWNARRLEEAKEEAKRVLDEEQAALEAIRNGSAHEHLDGATSLADLHRRRAALHEASRGKP